MIQKIYAYADICIYSDMYIQITVQQFTHQKLESSIFMRLEILDF
jgi:hypothetical protein